ncbi:uncharacterized protein LOC112550277 [Alligator sinensis]|uniref:Uncharacterized protein LOC112550277 n=1 Tax=Alligator sinensis TaxID=38654 RepID=A0A3Q0GJL4_ALLSI|nr:uncharacterized protein LOC112550277 [Alligator sinensis]
MSVHSLFGVSPLCRKALPVTVDPSLLVLLWILCWKNSSPESLSGLVGSLHSRSSVAALLQRFPPAACSQASACLKVSLTAFLKARSAVSACRDTQPLLCPCGLQGTDPPLPLSRAKNTFEWPTFANPEQDAAPEIGKIDQGAPTSGQLGPRCQVSCSLRAQDTDQELLTRFSLLLKFLARPKSGRLMTNNCNVNIKIWWKEVL